MRRLSTSKNASTIKCPPSRTVVANANVPSASLILSAAEPLFQTSFVLALPARRSTLESVRTERQLSFLTVGYSLTCVFCVKHEIRIGSFLPVRFLYLFVSFGSLDSWSIGPLPSGLCVHITDVLRDNVELARGEDFLLGVKDRAQSWWLQELTTFFGISRILHILTVL